MNESAYGVVAAALSVQKSDVSRYHTPTIYCLTKKSISSRAKPLVLVMFETRAGPCCEIIDECKRPDECYERCCDGRNEH